WRDIRTLAPQNFVDFYRNFSRKSGLHELKDLLDLEKSGRGNKTLIDAAILQNLEQIDSSRLDATLKHHQQNSEVYSRYKTTLLLSSLAVAVGLFTIFNLNDAFHRTITFWQDYEMPNPYQYNVQPGDITLEQGSTFQAE